MPDHPFLMPSPKLPRPEGSSSSSYPVADWEQSPMFPHSILLSGGQNTSLSSLREQDGSRHFPEPWKRMTGGVSAGKRLQEGVTAGLETPTITADTTSLPLTSVPEHQRPLLPPAARGGGAVLGRRPGAARGRWGRRGRGSSRRREPHMVIPAAGKPGSPRHPTPQLLRARKG